MVFDLEPLLHTKDAIAIINTVIDEALRRQASDIHIDPEEEHVNVRIRIDGLLYPLFTFPKHIQQELIARIKILSELRTDEHRTSQDGRFKITKDKEIIDIRVSVIPTYYGENAVMRLLRSSQELLSLTSLGFSEKDAARIEDSIHKSSGMILVTGPTGSGKTTTLYTLLNLIKSSENSITTIEDPIEYAIPGIRQIQAHHQKGLSFAQGLRAIMRQDPDIIMVGEIRDHDTASVATHAALTGHLLFTTLHTNNAVTALIRLIDLHIEPYLIASTVELVISQRLVRKICENCRQSGCPTCNQTGFFGRTVIYELLTCSDDLRACILEKAPAHILEEQAVKDGFVSIEVCGLATVAAGITTHEEMMTAL
jgi:type II secretory ATPase GspE/PulE/Tfp pilus assembly ATPase PilB-like protein